MKSKISTYHMIKQEVLPGVQAKQAEAQDLSAIQQLLYATAVWLKSKGSTQWAEILQGEDKHGIAGAVERGEVFIFVQDAQLAGVVILQQHASAWDLELWGEREHSTSVYLHRLAIHRDFSGMKLAGSILDWAVDGIQFPGKDRVRLDCIASVPPLNHLYASAGFQDMGQSATGFNLFERMQAKLL